MEFAEIDLLLDIYHASLLYYRSKIQRKDSDTYNQFILPEVLPKESCARFYKEFRSNIFSHPKEITKPYLESLYYDSVVYLLLKLAECSKEYLRVFGINREYEILANDYESPLSLLAGHIWKTAWELGITELKEFCDLDLSLDYDVDGNYKLLFNINKPVLKRDEQDQPKTRAIHILPEARPALIECLIEYIDLSQQESLKDLINEDLEPEQPIIWLSQQAQLGRIFYRQVAAKDIKDRKITTAKKVVAEWICQHFVRNEAGEIKKLSESTILNALSNKGLSK